LDVLLFMVGIDGIEDDDGTGMDERGIMDSLLLARFSRRFFSSVSFDISGDR
jgi:hypothetical protein